MIVEDVEEKRRIPVKVRWAVAAGAAALSLLWLADVLDQDAREPHLSGHERRAEANAEKPDIVALRPQVHALYPVIVKLKPLIEKDTIRSAVPNEE